MIPHRWRYHLLQVCQAQRLPQRLMMQLDWGMSQQLLWVAAMAVGLWERPLLQSVRLMLVLVLVVA